MKERYNILIIDDDVVPLTRVVVQCLGIQNKLDIHVLNLGKIEFPSYRFSKYVRSFSQRKAETDNQAVEAMLEACRKVNADVVIPIKEKTVRIVSENIDALREITNIPPMPDPEVLETVRNKWLLYNWLFDRSLIQDKPLKFDTVKNDISHYPQLKFPFLIKPSWGSGGRGIHLIKNVDEFNAFIPDKEFDYDGLIIQSYIKGYDIDISALVIKGKILFYAIQKGLPGNNRMVYSKAIEFVKNDQLLDQASIIFAMLNFSGIAHLDFRFNEMNEHYELIDFNARYWSSLLGSLNVGINFPLHACQYAIGLAIPNTEYKADEYYITYNPFKFIFRHIPIRKTELRYDLRDPLPLLMDLYNRILLALKSKIRMN